MLLLIAMLPACSSRRWFAPRENLNGSSPTGFPAAVYPVASGDDVRGDVRIWSDGTAADTVQGAEITTLHVGFEIENTGATPLALDLDALRLERLQIGGETGSDLRPNRVIGDSQAPPGGRATVQFWFEPGSASGPRDVDAFDVRWRVRADPVAFDQVTPFAPWVRADPWEEPWPHGSSFGFGFSAFRWCR